MSVQPTAEIQLAIPNASEAIASCWSRTCVADLCNHKNKPSDSPDPSGLFECFLSAIESDSFVSMVPRNHHIIMALKKPFQFSAPDGHSSPFARAGRVCRLACRPTNAWRCVDKLIHVFRYLIGNKASQVERPVLNEAQSLLQIGEAVEAGIPCPSHQEPLDLQASQTILSAIAAEICGQLTQDVAILMDRFLYVLLLHAC